MSEPSSDGVDDSFSRTQLVEPVAGSAPQPPSPKPPEPAHEKAADVTTTAPATPPLASRGLRQLQATIMTALLSASASVAKVAARAVRGRRPPAFTRPRLGVVLFVLAVAALLAWRSVQNESAAAVSPPSTSGIENRGALEDALERDDPVAVMALLRGDDSARSLLLRADSAVRLGRSAEAFELAERAAKVDSCVRSEPTFARVVVAALSSVPSSRVAEAVKNSPTKTLLSELRKALVAPEYKKRHGAQHVLTLLGEKVDETRVLYVDLLQLSECDARRAVAKTLLRRAKDGADLREVLAFAKSRDRDGCLDGIEAPPEPSAK